MYRLITLIIYVLTLSACASTEQTDFKSPLTVPYDAHTPPLYFSGLKIDLPKGEDIGVLSHGNRLCGFPYQPVGPDILRGETTKAELQQVFENALEPLGYDVVSTPIDFFFEEEAENELLRTEYKIGAKLIAIDVVGCGQDSAFGFFGFQREGVKGEMFATYEWSIFDNIQKSTIYKTTTSGYTKRKSVHRNGTALMIHDTFEMAAHNLGSDPQFYDLMVRGIKPVDINVEQDVKKYQERTRIFDPNESVFIESQKYSKNLNLQKVQAATVLIQNGFGHGSGFFITKEGHILTNAHVVGNARRVRVTISDKVNAMSAEVLRTDKVNDVALLKLENRDTHHYSSTLPLRIEWPDVGEDVYAIGTPLKTTLQDTVTKGIISAHRKEFQIFGQSRDLLQADVSIQSGNSGGPLIDAKGNIVALSVAGIGKTNESLNYFIPIGSVLETLNIQYTAKITKE